MYFYKFSTQLHILLKLYVYVFATGAIEKWKRNNNDWPNRIIVYRDGVGDGQLQMVVDYEIPQLLACFTEIPRAYRYACKQMPSRTKLIAL